MVWDGRRNNGICCSKTIIAGYQGGITFGCKAL